MNIDMKNVRESLRVFSKATGTSLSQIADRLGMTRQSLHQWLEGPRNLDRTQEIATFMLMQQDLARTSEHEHRGEILKAIRSEEHALGESTKAAQLHAAEVNLIKKSLETLQAEAARLA